MDFGVVSRKGKPPKAGMLQESQEKQSCSLLLQNVPERNFPHAEGLSPSTKISENS